MRGSANARWAGPRAAIWAAVGLMATVAGCGGASEATRFVPASAPDPDRSAADRARPEVRKIEMH